MTTTLAAPPVTAAPASGGRARWVVPAGLLPAVDLLGLAVAGWLARVPALCAAGYAVAVVTLLAADGQHRLRICGRVGDQVPRLAGAAALPLPAVVVWAGSAAVPLGLYSAGLLVTLRMSTYAGLRCAHRRGHLMEPTVIVGTGATAVLIAELARGYPELGLAPAGFLDSRPPQRPVPLPVLAHPAALSETVRRYRIRRVIVCFPEARDAAVARLLRACRPLPADVCLVPRMFELGAALPLGCLDDVRGIPLVPLRRLGHGRVAAVVKSAFDRTVGALLLVAVAPLLGVLAAAVLVRHGRPALFQQVRLTRAGAPVRILKLRSMTPHAGADVCWGVPAGHVTGLGGWLRATHLDELPQLLNVLRGEMSLVGPRPERPYFAARFERLIPGYADRLRVPAGITGWAQVHGLHGDTSIAERVRFDNQYIEYWSPWLDVTILIRTLWPARHRMARVAVPGPVPSGRGACSGGER